MSVEERSVSNTVCVCLCRSVNTDEFKSWTGKGHDRSLPSIEIDSINKFGCHV